ncbi:gliding motility-associated C-terminal domain-containing protein [Mucilaginibacter sp. JRF]|uniref:Ig-like domain-containing protein n=1 Tax=Mucilaginibacter sp. JRF TaxID=2780088 RepID=UPI001881F733|nr:gliding motility-associated C-terminal domain-containing protein [Mucilaginibacter sp. JRF]MBE9584847.1 gliding motility-associated C-terminal domain-containing protein [Mucilaginibacter sp. JRF]
MGIYTFIIRLLTLIFLLTLTTVSVNAQRIYANSQANGRAGVLCLNCQVTNPGNAVDGNPQTYSTIAVTVGLAASTYQDLIFTGSTKPAANTTMRFKVGTGDNLLSLTALGGISVQAYNGTNTVGPLYTAATLLGVASNNNQIELAITPTQIYDRIRITVNGGLVGALANLYVYEAYFNGPNPVPCNTAIDELNGISSGLLGLGVNVGGVANPQLAIDGNANTYSTLNAGVGVAGSFAQQTIIFQSQSVIGDSLRLNLAIPQGLLDLGLLTRISLTSYLGNTSNNDEQFLNASLLSVRLLDLDGDRRRVTVTYVPQSVYDRVQLKVGGGLANVLTSLNLYEAQRVLPKPVVSFNNTATTSIQSCAGSAVTLTVPAITGTTYNWYTTETGTTPAFTGTSFTTPVLNATTTYYVSASRTGCTDASDRTAVTITVSPIPVAPVIANAALTACPGQQATLSAQPVTGVTMRWYNTATGGTPVYTGNAFTTGALTTDTTFYVEAATGGGACISPSRTQVTVTLSPLPAAPALANANVSVCTGQAAAFTVTAPVNGVVYLWYNTATGGAAIFTGTSFVTPALTASQNYYVEAENATGCTSGTRTLASATVQPPPANPILAANNLTISAGQTATINVSNMQTGITYNWYTSATASTSVFSGTSFTTPELFATTTYYVEAVNSSGCPSAARTAISINVSIDTNAPCSFANQQTSTVNGLCIGCAVVNDALATDADTTTYSTISVLAGLTGAYAEQAMVFQQPGFAGDTVKLVLQSPVGLADVSLLGRIEVALYNNTTQVARYGLDQNTLTLRLLGGGDRYAVLIPANANYDRVTIRLASGVASLLTSLRVYYAVQQYATPVINPAVPEICAGGTAQLNITSPTTGTFNWYTTPTGGTPAFTGASITTPALTATTTYYIENVRNGCASATRYPVQILVGDPPASPVVTPSTASVTAGQTATFTTNVPNGLTVNWYTTATGGTPVFTGSSFTTPALTTNVTYYAEASAGSCVNPERTAIAITVNPAVIPDVAVTPPTQSVNAGASAALTASSTTTGVIFNWYTTATGGTSIYTGATFNTPAIFNNTTYYAEAVVQATGERSASRAAGIVNVNDNGVSPTPCDAAISQTTDIDGLVCLGCSVDNLGGVVDLDRNTFSRLNVPVGLLNAYVQQTLRFANTGRAGDSIVVELGVPGSLIDVGVLSQISLATYNGTTYNNDRFAVNGSLLNISLLNGTSRFRVAFKAGTDFDRVEIRLNSALAGLFTALHVYSAYQSVAAPVINVAAVATCQGSQPTLTAAVPDHVTVRWYTTPTGGSPVFTGTSFNTPALDASVTYYAEASRTASGCVQLVRTPVNVTVTPLPALPVVDLATINTCDGSQVTFTVQAVNGVTFNWYTSPTGGAPVSTGATFTTPVLTETTTYYVEANAGSCVSTTRVPVTAVLNALPPVPQITLESAETCEGSPAIITATSPVIGVIFRWYEGSTGGTPIFTGPQLTTPNLTENVTYYVDALLGDCVSATRVPVNVTVNAAPAVPTVATIPANGEVASGESASVTASSSTAGVTYNWYTSASGGTPIYTGTTFNTPVLSSNTTYYVEAQNGPTGCFSVFRRAVVIRVRTLFSTECDFASSQTTDVNGGAACVDCEVTNPNYPVDPDTTNFSQLNLPVAGAGAYVAQTLIFSNGGLAGDTVRVKIGVPASLTSADVLQRIQIASFNGTTYNNDRTSLNGNNVSIEQIDDQTAIIKFVPAAVYSRVEVRLNSVTAATFNTVDIYYATKQVELPQLEAGTVNVCSGSPATFTVSNARAGVIYRWYAGLTDDTPLFTGTSFTTDELTATTTYYVESVREANDCANPNRVAVTANVTATPANATLDNSSAQICAGESVTFTVTNANGSTVRWYSTATNGTLLFTGASYTVSPVSNATYYAELSNGECASPARTAATVTVNPRPAAPGLVAGNVAVCTNETAVLQIQNPETGVTYSWYADATGGTALATGTSFTTPQVTANATYYVDATNTTTGCANNGGRTVASVTVNETPAAPTLSTTTSQVCSGGSVTISVTNPVAGRTYNWYTSATGGTAVFTGTSYTLTNVTANASYYVDAVSASSCTSITRTRTDVTVMPVPDAPQAQLAGGGNAVCSGSSATLTIVNPQAELVYRWYTTATGGSPVYTGTQYATPAITGSTTYYIEAANAGDCTSSTRSGITINATALPAAPALAQATVSVCQGSTATLSVSSPQTGITYNWYNSPSRTTLLFTGSSYTTGPINANTTYYVSATNASGCSSSDMATAQVTVQPAPDAPVVNGGGNTANCSGGTVTLSIANPNAGFTYRWYSEATGGSVVFTGSQYAPVVTASATYYVEAVNGGGCTSSARTAVPVTVTPPPAAPVSAQGASICAGTSTELTVTTPAGVSVKWYSNATGGTELFTGSTYTTPILNSNTTYYAEAVSDAGGCVSATRTAVSVLVLSELNAPVLSGGETSTSSATFSWTSINGATGYQISTNEGQTFTDVGNVTTYTVTGLQANSSVTVVVRAIGINGCQTSANSNMVTARAVDQNEKLIFVPNAFTPNGDGNNDILYVYGSVIQSLNFQVYTQWGEQIFRTNTQANGWDGTFKGSRVPVGVYVYVMEVTTTDGQKINRKGTITLLR